MFSFNMLNTLYTKQYDYRLANIRPNKKMGNIFLNILTSAWTEIPLEIIQYNMGAQF